MSYNEKKRLKRKFWELLKCNISSYPHILLTALESGTLTQHSKWIVWAYTPIQHQIPLIWILALFQRSITRSFLSFAWLCSGQLLLTRQQKNLIGQNPAKRRKVRVRLLWKEAEIQKKAEFWVELEFIWKAEPKRQNFLTKDIKPFVALSKNIKSTFTKVLASYLEETS